MSSKPTHHDRTLCTGAFRRLSLLPAQKDGSYKVSITASDIPIHPDLPCVPVWCYEGQMPGPVIVGKTGQETIVRYKNDLSEGAQTPFAAGINPPAPAAPPPGGGMGGMDHTAHSGHAGGMGGMDHTGHSGHTGHAGGMEHGAWIKGGLNTECLVHLHGAVVEPKFDGNPGTDAGIAPGDIRTFRYPNCQRPTLLWYHDHSMGETAGKVFAGLAGGYLIPEEKADVLVDLPKGDQEVALVIQDKNIDWVKYDKDGKILSHNDLANADGSAYEPQADEKLRFSYFIDENSEYQGFHFLVNGSLRPKAKVSARVHRVRILNACQGRFLKLWLRPENGAAMPKDNPITMIGAEGGLLREAVAATVGFQSVTGPKPTIRTEPGVFLTPAGRVDLIVDFSKLTPGGTYTLLNQVNAFPYNNGNDDGDAAPEVIMQFEVSGEASADGWIAPGTAIAGDDAKTAPVTLQEALEKIKAEGKTVREATMVLSETTVDPMDPTTPKMQLINGRHFMDEPLDGMNETFTQGEWVRLTIRNQTPDAHPIHLHLVTYWAEGREAKGGKYPAENQELTALYGAMIPTQEAGLIDTVWCPPGAYRPVAPDETDPNPDAYAETTILVRFPDSSDERIGHYAMKLVGRYMFHCHIVEHEDHDMMRAFAVNTPGAMTMPMRMPLA